MQARIATKRWIALPLALFATVLPAASAQAALGLANAVATPTPDTNAGHHSDFNLSFDITGADHIKDLVTELPPGLVGNPTSAGYCVPIQLPDNCPADSIIGSAKSNVTATVTPSPLPQADVPLMATGNVYNMIPQGSDPATLGVVLHALSAGPVVSSDPVVLIGHASARTDDFGLNTTILNIPNTATVTLFNGILNFKQTSPVHITRTELTLNSSFMTNPTSCGTKTTKITGTSYEGDTQTVRPAFDSINCAAERYNPHLGVTIDMSKDGAHILNPDLTTVVTQGIDEANSKRVEAILPSTVQANNDALNHQCPLANFQTSSCAPNTQVGTALARTPLLAQPLQGPVYLIQNAGLLPEVGLDLRGPLPAKIIGNATPTSDLRLDNVFGDIAPGLPDVPLSEFKLTFGGGPGGLIVATEAVCQGPSQYNAIFDSFGGQHVTQASNANVIGCGFANRLKKGRCEGKKLTDVGTRHRDTIRGTKKRDVINGLGGNDRIIGLGGNDILCGGGGNDTILGGKGKDQLSGGPGKDKLVGGPGKDKIKP
jgi:RTX calcium-binding nonapeptide repeat (4 copies)